MGVSNDTIQTVVAVATALCGLVLGTGSIVATVFIQAKKNREEFWLGLTALNNTMVNKLDEHDKKDDRRIERITTELWDIKLRNARIDGDPPPPRHSYPLLTDTMETE